MPNDDFEMDYPESEPRTDPVDTLAHLREFIKKVPGNPKLKEASRHELTKTYGLNTHEAAIMRTILRLYDDIVPKPVNVPQAPHGRSLREMMLEQQNKELRDMLMEATKTNSTLAQTIQRYAERTTTPQAPSSLPGFSPVDKT